MKKNVFHRGTLTIPIIDHNENLIFNVWTTISEENFRKRMDLWEDANRTRQDPYYGINYKKAVEIVDEIMKKKKK